MLLFLQNCLDGLMIGSSYALLAIGFTLIFGVMRRLNLAYGASIMMGIFAGTLLHVEVGAGLWAVAAATVVVAVLAGMYVERLCFWAVRRGVAVASMVSSFAIWMQLEEIVVVVAPERTYPFPPLTEAMPMSLGPFFVRADHLAMFGCALAMVAVLRFVLYRTRFGLIVRAVSENPTAAKAMGIDVGAVAFGAFALASASGGIAGLLIAATDQQITPYFGLWATYKGLIAMMLGGMGSIPGAIAGGLLLGVIEVQGLWYLGAKYRDIIAYLLLFGVLVLRPGGLLGQGLAEKAQAVQRRMRAMDAHLVSVLSNIGMISFIALSAYLLLLVGEISFGQQAFFAISAYTSGIATAMWGWDLWLGLLWGAGIAAISAAVIGLPTLRLTGLYFSIATLAFAELVRHVLLIVRYQVAVGGDVIGPDGANGFRDIRYIYDHDISSVEYLGLIYLLLAAAVVTILAAERSRLGSMLRMVGEDAMLSEMQGLDVRRVKIGVSAAAGFLAGIGGGLYAHFTSYVEPNIFGVMLGVHSLAYALIGGLGTVLGPLIGVAIDIGFLESIRAVSGYRMIIFGGLVAGLLIIRPRGLLDEVAVHRLRSLGRRRRAEA